MSFTYYLASWLCVDKNTLSDGSGLGDPQLVSAVAVDASRVRLTFNQAMGFDHLGRGITPTLDPLHYVFTDLGGSHKLMPMRVEQYSDTQVDIITNFQRATTYEVAVHRLYDDWGRLIDSANDTAQFSGTEPVFPSGSADMFTFYGLNAGMQEDEQIDVLPDLTGPYLQNQNPGPSDTDVALDSNVEFEVVDAETGINPFSVIVYIDGAIAWQNDAQQPGFTVVKTAIGGGYRYTVNPFSDFASFDVIPVRVIAANQAPLPVAFDGIYSFRTVDLAAPYLANLDPFNGQTNIAPTANISLDLLDDGEGVDAATVRIAVDGVTVWQSDTQQPGYAVTKSSVTGGYRYLINPDVPMDQLVTIPVYVEADDLAASANSFATTYYFDTGTDDPPVVCNQSPAPNATRVEPDAKVKFDITDNVAVDEGTVLITVNGILAYSGSSEQNGFTIVRTVIAQGYHYQVTNPLEWSYNEAAEINVFAVDTLGIPVNVTWWFTATADEACFAGPLNATEAELLGPFTSLDYTERLRLALVAYMTTTGDPIEAARAIYLRGHSQEFAPILHGIVATPTDAEAGSRLCNKSTNLSVSNSLRRKSNLLPGAIRELVALGLPYEHRALLEAYAREDQPNTEVPLACVIVLLAKAFE